MNKLILIALLFLTACHHDKDAAPEQVPLPEPETRAVEVSWMAVTENTDGTQLTDLAGYYLYFGNLAEDHVRFVEPHKTSYIVLGLSDEYYYFMATAVNSSWVESDFSDVVWR